MVFGLVPADQAGWMCLTLVAFIAVAIVVSRPGR